MFPLPFALPGLSTLKWIGAAIAAGAVAIATYQVVHAFDSARYAKLETSVAQASTDAVRAGAAADSKQADISIKSATDEAGAQSRLAATAAVIKQKVKVHVAPLPVPPVARGCVSYGLVRQHDAAALGVDPDTLPLPAGSADDACSPVADTDLADAIADNYAAARANAEQLEALERDIRARVDALDPPH